MSWEVLWTQDLDTSTSVPEAVLTGPMQPYPAVLAVPGLQTSPERSQQVSELLAQIPACRPLNRDQSLFELPVRLRDGRQTTLRISLPPNFPQGRPGLSVTHPLRHPWVDAAGRLSFAALDQWAAPRSRLVALVQEAAAALTGQPLPLAAGSPASRPGTAGAPSPSSSASAASRVPAIPREFPEVAALSDEQLLAALTQPDAFRRLLQGIVDKSQLVQVQDQLRKGCAELAAANLAQEQALSELRNQIAIIRSSEYAAAREAYDEVAARRAAVLERLEPSALLAQLARKAAATDAESEEMYDRFVEGALPAERFLGDYVKLRTAFHERELRAAAARQTIG